MLILDTSFIYAFLQTTDTNHKRALKYSEKLKSNDLLVPIDVVKELLTIVNQKKGTHEALIFCKLLLKNDGPVKVLYGSEKVFKDVWSVFIKLSPHKLSYVDCLLVTMSKQLNCEVLTFDKNLNKILAKTS